MTQSRKLTTANMKDQTLETVLGLETSKNFSATIDALSKTADVLKGELAAYTCEGKEYLDLTGDAVEFSQLNNVLDKFNRLIEKKNSERRAVLSSKQRPSSKTKIEKAIKLGLNIKEVEDLLNALKQSK